AMHAARDVDASGRSGGHRAGGDRIPGWPRHAARDRAGRVRGASDRRDRGGTRGSRPRARNGAMRAKGKSSMIPAVKAKLLEGKRGLIVGIANENSIAWGCAKAFRALGAELAVTYLNDKAKKYVDPLARELEAPIVMPLDVSKPGEMEAVFERITKDW